MPAARRTGEQAHRGWRRSPRTWLDRPEVQPSRARRVSARTPEAVPSRLCTAKNAPKLTALRHNAAVALTIDTEVHPPKILLIRGRAELDVVEGIPDEYLETSGTYQMTPDQRVEWEAEVRSLYDGMVRIVVTPTWAKLIDFETTLPSAVEELARQRDERQRS